MIVEPAARLDFAFLAGEATLDEGTNTYGAVGAGLRAVSASTWPTQFDLWVVVALRVPAGVQSFEVEIVGKAEEGQEFMRLGMPIALADEATAGTAVDVRPPPVPLEVMAHEPGVVEIQVLIDGQKEASLPLHFVMQPRLAASSEIERRTR